MHAKINFGFPVLISKIFLEAAKEVFPTKTIREIKSNIYIFIIWLEGMDMVGWRSNKLGGRK